MSVSKKAGSQDGFATVAEGKREGSGYTQLEQEASRILSSPQADLTSQGLRIGSCQATPGLGFAQVEI